MNENTNMVTKQVTINGELGCCRQLIDRHKKTRQGIKQYKETITDLLDEKLNNISEDTYRGIETNTREDVIAEIEFIIVNHNVLTYLIEEGFELEILTSNDPHHNIIIRLK